MASADLQGDEITWRGEVVAIVMSDGRASLLGEFCDAVRSGEISDSNGYVDGIEQAVADIRDRVAKAARGGLIRVADVQRICDARLEEIKE